MYRFNKAGKLLLVLSILFLIPAAGYAIADVSAYGGYSFSGEMTGAGENYDTSGWLYGLYGHYNTGIPMVFTVGLGGFYQISQLDAEAGGKTYDATKTAIGVDVYGQLDLPVIPVKPYLRYGHAVKETIEFEDESYNEYFKSNYYGIGFCYTLFSFTKFDLQVFAEYLYASSKQEDDIKIKGNVINLGLKAAI